MMTDYQNYKLGVDDDLIELESRQENREVITLMLQQAVRTIEIVSHLLDPPIYNATEFIEAMRNFIINHNRCKVRIIVFEPGTIVTHGHRLLDYAGTLSSFVEIRKAGDEFREYNGALFITDDVAYVHRNHAERYEGLANFNDRREAHFLLQQFNRMWDTAKPDPNLRHMRI